MQEFFRGWKRKVGVVTLLMACLFTAGWIRSLYYQDHMKLPDFDQERQGQLDSQDGWFRWSRGVRFKPRGPLDGLALGGNPPFSWTSRPINKELWSSIVPNDGPGVRFRFMGLSIGTFGGDLPTSFCCFPYSLLVIPLALLSVWLLLSKPRSTKPSQILRS